MERFHIIDDGAVILRSRGVFKQAKVYRRGADVYAGHGSGFIKLGGQGGTSMPSVSWIDIEADGVMADAKPRPRWLESADQFIAENAKPREPTPLSPARRRLMAAE